MRNLKMFLWLTLLTGIIYPLAILFVAQVGFKSKADGNIIFHKGKEVGAKLIGQKFENPKYFWGRPSAVDYNPLPSGGSNLGPISAKLKALVSERKEKLSKTDPTARVPSELLFASGSGLDPHITPQAALFQVERIRKARNLPDKKSLTNLIEKMTITALLGPSYVNVLELNLALDGIE
jgi:K+-transporting ATPase ATPase C chain